MADTVEIRTIAEAMTHADGWQRLYELERDAHAETLRKLELERIVSGDLNWWIAHNGLLED